MQWFPSWLFTHVHSQKNMRMCCDYDGLNIYAKACMLMYTSLLVENNTCLTDKDDKISVSY